MGTIKQRLDDIKMVNKDGKEYWSTRELMEVLDYDKWDKFQNVIKKAIVSVKRAGNKADNHFLHVEKMVRIGSGAERKISDWLLSKYACYLIAQNSDASKRSVAEAQAYFAIQTHKQELFEQLPPDKRRLLIREEVIDHNKMLNKAAQQAGVKNFGSFHDSGYQGLYGMRYQNIVKYKKLGKNKLNQPKANVLHFIVGKKVRKAIKEIGGTMPEDLPPEKHIKEIQGKVDKEEQKMLEDYNAGKYTHVRGDKKRYIKIAKATLNK